MKWSIKSSSTGIGDVTCHVIADDINHVSMSLVSCTDIADVTCHIIADGIDHVNLYIV